MVTDLKAMIGGAGGVGATGNTVEDAMEGVGVTVDVVVDVVVDVGVNVVEDFVDDAIEEDFLLVKTEAAKGMNANGSPTRVRGFPGELFRRGFARRDSSLFSRLPTRAGFGRRGEPTRETTCPVGVAASP
jgi:hypothetical protein